jgi:hypothetical protein
LQRCPVGKHCHSCRQIVLGEREIRSDIGSTNDRAPRTQARLRRTAEDVPLAF